MIFSQNKQVKITFGFSCKYHNQFGVMMYHNNRLIKAFEKVGCQLKVSGYCRFVSEACKEWEENRREDRFINGFQPHVMSVIRFWYWSSASVDKVSYVEKKLFYFSGVDGPTRYLFLRSRIQSHRVYQLINVSNSFNYYLVETIRYIGRFIIFSG